MTTTLLTAVAAACAAATPVPANRSWLRPQYHFTRAQYHMNDPNGLMWRHTTAGELQYHMFFQSSNPGQVGASEWGHAVSPDLAQWTRLPRTGIRGSTGGGVAVPEDFHLPAELKGAKAVTINSAPTNPTRHPATGLHLYYSMDDALLNWAIYRNARSVQSSTNETCIICPEDVPAHLNPGYIGDNYVWVEKGTAAGEYTFYVLSGSNKCPANDLWCTYASHNSTAQAFLFQSRDLLHWTFISVFAGAQKVGGSAVTHIDTPETFALDTTTLPNHTATQAFVYLADGHGTQWQVGSLDPSTKTFSSSGLTGFADRGNMLCQQSLTTPNHTRVSFGWVQIHGDGWDGAQTLPRVVDADAYGLRYAPLPTLDSLHSDFHFEHQHSMGPTDPPTLFPDVSQFGNRLHMTLDLQLASPGGGPDGPGSISGGSDSSASGESSFWMDILDGAVKVNISYGEPVPPSPRPSPAPTCSANKIYNNSDVEGFSHAFHAIQVEPEDRSPQWCQAKCCSTTGCSGWVYADPQPQGNHNHTHPTEYHPLTCLPFE